MAKLSTYQSIEEKKDFFTVRETIKTKNEFDNFFENLSEESGSIWRGSGESEFKIYTSLQRFWIQRDLPNDSREVVKYLKSIYDIAIKENNGLLLKYFENYGIKNVNLLSILSILRHHEAPTPLIDFTRNPLVALYFAAIGSNLKFTDKEIENNFSLYELTKNHQVVYDDIKGLSLNYWKTQEIELEELNRNLIKPGDDISKIIAEAHLISDEFLLSTFATNNSAFKIEDLVNDKIKFFIKNNYNITNQEGLFVINSNPIEPLEKIIINPTMVNSDTKKDHFICYEIHKNLKEYVLKKLEDKGVDNDFIYPNLYKITNEILKKHLEK